jgi:hypothetical protein
MSIRLTTWHNSHLGHDERLISQEYTLTFDQVSGNISERYCVQRIETFQTVSEMAQRIAELQREDPDKHVRFTNCDHYSDKGHILVGEDFVQLSGDSAATGGRLSEGEFAQLTHEVLAALRGK